MSEFSQLREQFISLCGQDFFKNRASTDIVEKWNRRAKVKGSEWTRRKLQQEVHFERSRPLASIARRLTMNLLTRKKDCILLDLPQWPERSGQLQSLIEEQLGLDVICSSNNSLLYHLRKLSVSGIYPLEIRQFATGERDSIVWHEIAKNSAFIEKCRLRIFELERILRKYRIKSIISTDLHSTSGLIIAYSAQKALIPTMEYSHAILYDPGLISVAPIVADRELLWSNHCMNYMRTHSPEQVLRCEVVGVPQLRPKISSSTAAKPSAVLLLLEIKEIFSSEYNFSLYIKLVRKIIDLCKSNNIVIKLREHPKYQKLERYRREFSDVDFSTGGFTDALSSISFVVGASSSTLAEASANGIGALSVSELRLIANVEEISGIPSVTIEQLSGFILGKNETVNNYFSLDNDRIIDILKLFLRKDLA